MLWANCCSTLLWHLAQVVGTLNLKMGDFGSLAARISCEPWQSVQTAAFSDPAATALPCTLSSYEINTCELCPLAAITNFCPWHTPQVAGILAWFTRDFGSEAGSTSCGLP